jgi:hypothetical protein
MSTKRYLLEEGEVLSDDDERRVNTIVTTAAVTATTTTSTAATATSASKTASSSSAASKTTKRSKVQFIPTNTTPLELIRMIDDNLPPSFDDVGQFCLAKAKLRWTMQRQRRALIKGYNITPPPPRAVSSSSPAALVIAVDDNSSSSDNQPSRRLFKGAKVPLKFRPLNSNFRPLLKFFWFTQRTRSNSLINVAERKKQLKQLVEQQEKELSDLAESHANKVQQALTTIVQRQTARNNDRSLSSNVVSDNDTSNDNDAMMCDELATLKADLQKHQVRRQTDPPYAFVDFLLL